MFRSDELNILAVDIESLKHVLRVIAGVKEITTDAEMTICDITERYHMMDLLHLEVSAEEVEMVANLNTLWADLVQKSSEVQQTLIGTKKVFAEVTRNDIEQFQLHLAEFIKDFRENGPGSVTEDLDLGQTLVVKFRGEIDKVEKKRLELVSAERLFDLPPQSYSDFILLQKDLEDLELIYSQYVEQKAKREEWGETLWVNLNMQELQEGTEHLFMNLRKLPKALKSLEPYKALEKTVRDFRDSLPLIADLKNESLRERHWKELMSKTDIYFDMRPDIFSLEHIFNMELNRFVDVIGNILNAAMKEQAIEKGIRDLEETWSAMKLTVVKYFKGTSDRGYVITALNEITPVLEDNIMQLQGMAVSR